MSLRVTLFFCAIMALATVSMSKASQEQNSSGMLSILFGDEKFNFDQDEDNQTENGNTPLGDEMEIDSTQSVEKSHTRKQTKSQKPNFVVYLGNLGDKSKKASIIIDGLQHRKY